MSTAFSCSVPHTTGSSISWSSNFSLATSDIGCLSAIEVCTDIPLVDAPAHEGGADRAWPAVFSLVNMLADEVRRAV
jgi:hypothetical protein